MSRERKRTGEAGEETSRERYSLSSEERTYPAGRKGSRKWYDDMVAFQLEGIEAGVRPQLIRDLPSELRPDW